jgi:hypothetical protein
VTQDNFWKVFPKNYIFTFRRWKVPAKFCSLFLYMIPIFSRLLHVNWRGCFYNQIATNKQTGQTYPKLQDLQNSQLQIKKLTSHNDSRPYPVGRVNLRWKHFFLQIFKKHLCLNMRYICIETRRKTFVKIRAPWPSSCLHAKNLCGPLGPNKIGFKLWFIVINDQLGQTVSTKQTINWFEFMGLRYPTKCAWISPTKPNSQISACFVWYLIPPMNSD